MDGRDYLRDYNPLSDSNAVKLLLTPAEIKGDAIRIVTTWILQLDKKCYD